MNSNEQKLREVIDFEFRSRTHLDAGVGIYVPILRKDSMVKSIISHPDVQALLNGEGVGSFEVLQEAIQSDRTGEYSFCRCSDLITREYKHCPNCTRKIIWPEQEQGENYQKGGEG